MKVSSDDFLFSSEARWQEGSLGNRFFGDDVLQSPLLYNGETSLHIVLAQTAAVLQHAVNLAGKDGRIERLGYIIVCSKVQVPSIMKSRPALAVRRMTGSRTGLLVFLDATAEFVTLHTRHHHIRIPQYHTHHSQIKILQGSLATLHIHHMIWYHEMPYGYIDEGRSLSSTKEACP